MKIVVIGSHPKSLVNFRGHLLAALASAGHEVHAVAPGLLSDLPSKARLDAMGIIGHDIPMARTGLNPLADLRTFFALQRLLRAIAPHATLGYTIKPVIWGSLAATMARVPRRFALITGLGYAFTGTATGKRRLVQALARWLYRRALARCELVFFQNPDDQRVFRDLDLVPATVRSVVVNGSGVDTQAFAAAPLPPLPVRFLMIARLLGDKGIREFAKAAAVVRARYPEVECHLVGGADSNPDAINSTEIAAWVSAGTLIAHGELSDVRPSIAACHVYILPSYREGTPRTVLEAMAMGRAIITTDAPGCRETTQSGVNGYLVPVADAAALAAAMLRFVDHPELIAQMGQRSRQIAEEKYDVRRVNAHMLAEMNL